jgi:hypothetical protein
MPKLRCLQHYDNAPYGLHYKPGQVFEASPELRLWLSTDAPGIFEDYAPEAAKEVKEVAAPPRDKAVKRAPRTKAARSKQDEND